jgi:hypothetical protein
MARARLARGTASMLRTRACVPWAPGASTPRLGFLSSSKDRVMAELIWLIIVLIFGFACGYSVRASISRRRRAASRRRRYFRVNKKGA